MRKGFTLIELMVVVSIIGLLSSVVVVAINDRRESAQIARTKNFSGQIQHALGSESMGAWSFENINAGTVKDISGVGADATVSNIELTTNDGGIEGEGVKRGEAFGRGTISFPNDQVNVKSRSTTLEGWFMFPSLSSSSIEIQTDFSFEWGISNGTWSQISINWYNNEGCGSPVCHTCGHSIPYDFEPNKWYHVVVTYNHNTQNSKIFVNSELEDIRTDCGYFPGVTYTEGEDSRIWIHWGEAVVDEVRFYDAPLIVGE